MHACSCRSPNAYDAEPAIVKDDRSLPWLYPVLDARPTMQKSADTSSSDTSSAQPWLAYGLLALAPLCWAGNHIVGRFIAGQVPPGGLAVFRWLVTCVVLLPFAAQHWRRDWPALRAGGVPMVLLALTGGGIFGTLQYVGLNYTTALNVAMFNSLVPVCIILANLAIFRERVHRVQIEGIIISLLGVLTIIAKGDWQRLSALNFNGGDILVIANMMLFGVYSSCLRLKPNIHWLTFTLVLALVSGIANLPFAAWEMAHGNTLQANTMTAVAILYAGIFSSAVAYAAWSIGVARIGSGRSGAFLHLIPLYGAGLSSLFLGEHIQPFHLVGIAAILTGVTLAARRG
jgi:drug/metabolite transporter (DMT)-like permease